jgi:hypothetical protein
VGVERLWLGPFTSQNGNVGLEVRRGKPPAHPRAPERDRPIAQAQPPRFAEAVAVTWNGIERVTPLVPGAPKDAVHLFLQHPLQELLHALPGEDFQRLPGRA